MLTHLNLDFLLGSKDACSLPVDLLQVHLLLILLHELFEDLIVLLLELLHVEFLLTRVVLFLNQFGLSHGFVELFDLFRLC